MKKLLALLLLCALLVPASAALADGTPSICIVVAGSLGDRSFYDSANEGIERLAADYGTVIGVIECKEDASLYESALYDAAERYDIIAAVGWQFFDSLYDESGVLAAYPDKKFLFIDNALDAIPSNLMCITYTQNEGSFLAGFIAAKLSTSGVVGVVGGEDSDTINDFIVGYEAGAKYANPDVTVLKQYANTYEDPAKGKECALALYSRKADIVFAVAGKTGEGVFVAAKEVDKLAIGVDGDQKFIDPDRIVCSMVKQVGQSIYDVVANPDTYFRGGEVWNANMETGYIDVVYGTEDMPQQVSDELKAQVEEIKLAIISGEIVVPSAFAAE
ncbi:MAG: BMP family ABC transporter substrate-binding protein [Clostridia bacterium]|nr:BMP family ABC transporter substrate-binding protein [Clostridia bacterium]MBR4459326.1 BMP family ABC transporter substrate-binding protein [Clostridia bacterium]